MKLYRTGDGAVVERDGDFFRAPDLPWDALLTHEDLGGALRAASEPSAPPQPLAPIGGQEVWAAGVTYFRSRSARLEEVKTVTGESGDFYDRVYRAERPELFFKASAHRVVGPGQAVRIRRDARWNVPEPELTLAINARGKIIGYTIGNDMSSRDIEGENPLYLPQAKVYDGSCALGPAILVTDQMPEPATEIRLEVVRGGARVVSEATDLSQLKRDPRQLVEFLYRECSFPAGCFLMTGTGIVPADAFTLQTGDEIRITIAPIGTLINTVA
ncbi:MAG: fumarylacetoacetate hydrolase family protein [Armatimonadetes bacterium]|nr:fumarylacetoacetate hydrolase family protein [Armatimonadota bacterium]